MSEQSSKEHDQSVTVDLWKDTILSLAPRWEEVVKDVTPEESPSGVVYDLPDFAPGRTESFAIVDLRAIGEAGGIDEAHYHDGDETEVHYPISGEAIMVVGDQQHKISVGDALVINPQTAHFAKPSADYVVGIVSLPNFDPENYIPVTPETPGPDTVKFDSVAYAGYVALALPLEK